MKEFIEFIAKQLVDKPDNVIVEETTPDEKTIELTLKVDKSDIGNVIGKHGQNVRALRIPNSEMHYVIQSARSKMT